MAVGGKYMLFTTYKYIYIFFRGSVIFRPSLKLLKYPCPTTLSLGTNIKGWYHPLERSIKRENFIRNLNPRRPRTLQQL